jgi:hypothetical protein
MALAPGEALRLGRLLLERFPGKDPLGVRPVDLERWVSEAAPASSRPSLTDLETVQAAWYRDFDAADRSRP